MSTAAAFRLPAAGEATTPPEARGLARDEVRMLVAAPDLLAHRRVLDLPDVLHPGDLLVVNTSATLPAAVGPVHVSTQLDDGDWVVEVRRPGNDGPAGTTPGAVLRLPGGVDLHVRGSHPAGQARLWRATPRPATDRGAYLAEHGRPVTYPYVDGDWPLESRQNVYATVPGSAEMPSAGRPLSERVLVALMARGVVIAPIVLHTGVSSQESHEPPQPEQYVVPEATARLVNGTREARRRVVAVGTTVVRALETVASREGAVHPAAGWTSLVLGPGRPARAVDGLLTGLHEAEASHLDLLRAVAGDRLVDRSYDVVTHGPRQYLWHEFGDTMLFLP
ncbi:S-adenosylmethionine:tRNA ribosyltransferase-isomerase [Nocardioides panacis]|uniref:S-adenosylmethionine:tRNA ribosyltransferase-isomerase n=1 Tax=Nocardioides panacis TaxID=2849501 RepID=A0A975Y1Z7_9ACTN|nr:S-adenosylmethionine:tRNA ribosyltransferase-isomerase [Nocardioides panacis]QWZ10025.1 S-adenosylmethionine:tRNA ribosyltransferase-isomerase [Nocardioides panacis]